MATDESVPETLPRSPWLLTETRRSWLTTIGTTVGAFLVMTPVAIFSTLSQVQRIWVALLGGWIIFAALHALLTWLGFRGLAAAELSRAVDFDQTRKRAGSGPLRRPWARWLAGGESAPTWSVQLSLMALVGMGALVLNSSLRTPLLLGIGSGLVAASWVNVWVMYALQYARSDLNRAGLVFPGGGERSFTDYLYFSLMVQTTFGATDVAVESSGMRRAVMTHGVVAFVFNTVIVAMLVSLLLSAGG